MSGRFTNQIIRKLAWSAMKKSVVQVLTPRCRRQGMPEFGRFTSRDIEQIILHANKNIKDLMPYFINFDNLGNDTLEYSGLLELAIYRALLEAGIDPDYATSLIGDINWQFILTSGTAKFYRIRKKQIQLRTKDRMAFLGETLRSALKFPYSEPGYRGNFYRDGDVYCMNFYACAANTFFRQFGAEERMMFRKAICTFDYAVAELIANGVTYQREHTLSDGDGVCDQRWFFVQQKSL